MVTRQLSIRASRIVAAFTCMIALAGAGSAVAAEKFMEGTHYTKLPISVDTVNEDQVEVVEVFSYACIHCFNFDPFVEEWKTRQGEDVTFMRMPAIFSGDWEVLAQAFYTAQTLGVLDAVHTDMFEGIHVRQEDLRKADLLSDLFADKAEVEEEDFYTAHNSFSVRSRVQQAKAKGRAYQVSGVPAMIVNGKYRIDGRMAGGNAAMLEVVDFLVEKERQAAAQGAR